MSKKQKVKYLGEVSFEELRKTQVKKLIGDVKLKLPEDYMLQPGNDFNFDMFRPGWHPRTCC